ncbi:hypothetical protein MUP77_17910, partial [Candidatus Bathyarchaeota archaeon]|nr:hypothetical protein [Candidatus Bathyarchaeota archaeon]
MKKQIVFTALFLTLVTTSILSLSIAHADPAWITTLPPDPTDYYPWINYKQIGTGLRIIRDP